MEATDSNVIETEGKDKASFYTHAAEYWAAVPATVDGVLGGFGFISRTDIQGSVSFLKQLFKVGFTVLVRVIHFTVIYFQQINL
jgi:hypothetical protein